MEEWRKRLADRMAEVGIIAAQLSPLVKKELDLSKIMLDGLDISKYRMFIAGAKAMPISAQHTSQTAKAPVMQRFGFKR